MPSESLDSDMIACSCDRLLDLCSWYTHLRQCYCAIIVGWLVHQGAVFGTPVQPFSTSHSSSTSSTTILTGTRASPRPKISQTDWQCWPFSMRYVEKTSHLFVPLSSKPCFFTLSRQVVQASAPDGGTVSDIRPWLLLKEVHGEVLGETILKAFEVTASLLLGSGSWVQKLL